MTVAVAVAVAVTVTETASATDPVSDTGSATVTDAVPEAAWTPRFGSVALLLPRNSL